MEYGEQGPVLEWVAVLSLKTSRLKKVLNNQDKFNCFICFAYLGIIGFYDYRKLPRL